MKLFLLALLFCSLQLTTHAQKIVDILFVSNGKIVEDKEEATGLILLKELPDSIFERKDYTMNGPLQTCRTYKDVELTLLDGPYATYHKNGFIALAGQYSLGKRYGKWYYYNTNGKATHYNEYENDSLIFSKTLDTSTKETLALMPGEKEAEYKGGLNSLAKFLIKNLNKDIALKSTNGGKVQVGFMINTMGKVSKIYLYKSVEAILDEEALRVIYKMPDWIPAEQDGKKVNAYRIQPISFVLE